MAHDRNPDDDSDTGNGVESPQGAFSSQQGRADHLAQALQEGRRGIYFLGGDSIGAEKPELSELLPESLDCFPVWIRPDEQALDAHLNPKRIIRKALREVCDDKPGWFDRLANHFVGRAMAVGLRAGLIPSQDAEGWARVIEASPDRYLDGEGNCGLREWLADVGQAELRRQIAVRLMLSGDAVFDEIAEASAWLDFFLTRNSGDAEVWLARWIELGDTAFARDDVKFTRQTLALVNAMQPVVCWFDQMNGVMGRPGLAHEVAGMALDWVNCTTMVVIAVRRDVWEGGFLPVLPVAWSDRLSACSEWSCDTAAAEPQIFMKSPASDTASDFLMYADESAAGRSVELRRGIFMDAGERLPFVTVETDTDDDQRMRRVRWMTPDQIVWIGLAEPENQEAWLAFFAGFAATSPDAAAVKLVVPLFDKVSEYSIRAYAASEGIAPADDAVAWLDVLQLTPAGWVEAMEAGKRTTDLFLAASPLWNAITEPILELHRDEG